VNPGRIAEALEHAHPGWAVVPGYYSGYFTALPGAFYPYRDSGMIIAADPEELERRMRLVESSALQDGPGRPSPVHGHAGRRIGDGSGENAATVRRAFGRGVAGSAGR